MKRSTFAFTALLGALLVLSTWQPTSAQISRRVRNGRVAARGIIGEGDQGHWVFYGGSDYITRIAGDTLLADQAIAISLPAYRAYVEAWFDIVHRVGSANTRAVTTAQYESITCAGQPRRPQRTTKHLLLRNDPLGALPCSDLVLFETPLPDPEGEAMVMGLPTNSPAGAISLLLDSATWLHLHHGAPGAVAALESGFVTLRNGSRQGCRGTTSPTFITQCQAGTADCAGTSSGGGPVLAAVGVDPALADFTECPPGNHEFIFSPVLGARVEVLSSNGGIRQAFTDDFGSYLVEFTVLGIPGIPGFSPDQDHDGVSFEVVADFSHTVFNPRSERSRRFFLRKRTGSQIAVIDYTNFAPEVSMALIQGSILNDDGSVIPLVDPNHAFTARTSYDVVGTGANAQLRITGIAAPDMRDTDVYVFRQSDGRLIGTRSRLNITDLSGISRTDRPAAPGCANLACLDVSLLMRGIGSRRADGRTDGGADSQGGLRITPSIDEVAYGDRSLASLYNSYLRPGDRATVIMVNRAVGAVGRADGTLQITPMQGVAQLVMDGPVNMYPANLKVYAVRVRNGVTREGSNGVTSEGNVVGFEGSTTTQDNVVYVFTEWFDHEGRMLPPEVHGFTGRIAVSDGGRIHDGGGSGIGGSSRLFAIEPGSHAQVIRLPRSDVSTRQHVYIHVDAAEYQGSGRYSSASSRAPPDFNTEEVCYYETDGSWRCYDAVPEDERLGTRPASFVPVRVPVFDRAATALRAGVELDAAAVEGRAPRPVTPIYAWRRQAEYQFSTVVANVDSASRVHVFGSSGDEVSDEQQIRFTHTVPSEEALPVLANQREVWVRSGELNLFASLGGAVTDEVGEMSDAERRELMIQALISGLSPEDFLAVQLYNLHDQANVLDVLRPLTLFGEEPAAATPVDIQVANPGGVQLTRRYNTANFRGSVAVSAYQDSFEIITFTTTKTSEVTVFAQHAGGGGRREIASSGGRIAAGTYSVPVTYGDLRERAGLIPSAEGFELVIEARESSNISAVAQLAGTMQEFHDNLTLGQIVEHDVLLQDGSLRLSREDFSVAGRGPGLSFGRSYSNLGPQGSGGVLGDGWSHTLDMLLSPRFGADQTGSIPGWVLAIRGSVVTADAVSPQVESVTRIQVNGTEFIFSGGQWVPERGRRGSLVEAAGEFVFTSIDGTRYFYPAPTGNFPTQVRSVVDRNGNSLTFHYAAAPWAGPSDPQFELESVEDDAGRQLTFEYENDVMPAVGNVRRLRWVRGPLALALEFVYDERAQLVEARRGERVEVYEYAPQGGGSPAYNLVATRTTPDGVEFLERRFEYFEQGDIDPALQSYVLHHVAEDMVKSVTYPRRPDEVVDVREPRAEFAYQVEGGASIRRVTDPRGYETVYTLNNTGNPLRIEEPLGKWTSYTWDLDENVVLTKTESVRDDGHERTWGYSYLYDQHFRITEMTETDPYQNSSRTVYDSRFHVVTSHEDRNGNANVFQLDDRGNVLSATDGDDHITTYTYDPATGDRLTELLPENAHPTTWTYDSYGMPDVVTGPEGSFVDYEHDARGRRTAQEDALGNTTTYEYTVYDQLEYERMPALTQHTEGVPSDVVSGRHHRAQRHHTYDLLGNELSQQDLNGQLTSFTYTAQGQLKTTTRSGFPGVIRQTYDNNGNVVSRSDWRGAETTLGYDALNRLTSTTNRVGATETRAYDLAGNLTVHTDFGGRVTRYAYDDLDRNTREERVGSRGRIIDRFYFLEADPERNLQREVVDRDPLAAVETTYEYNGRYMRTKRTNARGREHLWFYDGNGRLELETDEEGNQTRRRYDQQGRLRYVDQRLDSAWVTTENQYDVVGNLIAVVDARGFTVSSDFDEWNRPWRVTDGEQHQVRTLRDGEGNEVHTIDGRGIGRATFRDQLGRPASARDGNGHSTAFTYDDNGNLETSTDARGTITRNLYDYEDRLISVTEAEGTTDSRTREIRRYDGMGNPELVTDWNGRETTTQFDEEYRPVRVEDARGVAAVTTYSRNGLVLSGTDRRGKAIEYGYDVLDRRELVRDALGQVATTTYDEVGNVRTVTDKREIPITRHYDDLYRLTSIQRGTVTIERHEYYPNGTARYRWDANNNREEYIYDERNLRTRVNYLDNTFRAFTYDAAGNLQTITNEDSETTTHGYDNENRRLYSEVNGRRITWERDSVGNVSRIIRPESQTGGLHAGRARILHYDRINRLREVIDEVADGNLTTTYGYDDNGNLRFVWDPDDSRDPDPAGIAANGTHVEHRYDNLNRRTLTIQHRRAPEADLEVVYDRYDNEGNLERMVDPMGQATEYTYDDLGRRVTATYEERTDPVIGNTLSVTWDYDGNDNVDLVTETRRMRGAGGTFTQVNEVMDPEWDTFDRLTSSMQRDRTVVYSYDDNGNRTGVSTSAGTTTYAYDNRNRLETATLDGSEQVTFDYEPDGLVDVVRFPNGTVMDYDYDEHNRVSRIRHQQGTDPDDNAPSFLQYAYTYDGNGNRLTEFADVGGVREQMTYRYDAVDRLREYAVQRVGEASTRTRTEYDYAVFNRSAERRYDDAEQLTQARAYAYDDVDRLTSVEVTLPGGTGYEVTYGHDANGNLARREDSRTPGEAMDFTYDSQNRLTQVTRGPPGAGAVLGEYDYDSRGRRTRSRGSSRGDVEYYYDGITVVEERLTGDGSLLGHYRYGDRLMAMDAPGGREWYHQDSQRTTGTMTDATGSVVSTYRLNPWGEMRGQTGSSTNRQIFTGHQHDTETGLIYMGARYYDPETGRFLTQDAVPGDPQNPPSLNRYLYVYGNPLAYTDPDGNVPFFTEARQWMEQQLDEVRSGMDHLDQERAAGRLSGAAAATAGVVGGLGRFAGKIVLLGMHAVEQVQDTTITSLEPGNAFSGDTQAWWEGEQHQARQRTSERTAAIRGVVDGVAQMLMMTPREARRAASVLWHQASHGTDELRPGAIANMAESLATVLTAGTSAVNGFRSAGGAFGVSGITAEGASGAAAMVTVPVLAVDGAALAKSGVDLARAATIVMAVSGGGSSGPSGGPGLASGSQTGGSPDGDVAWSEEPSGGPGDILPTSGMQRIDLSGSGWRQTVFPDSNDSLVYILRDLDTNEILKVGKSEASTFLGRFQPYARAGRRTGRRVGADVFSFESSSVSPEAVEAQVRGTLESQGHPLPWDNTAQRLGRPGPGVPGSPVPRRLRGNYRWNLEDEILQSQ